MFPISYVKFQHLSFQPVGPSIVHCLIERCTFNGDMSPKLGSIFDAAQRQFARQVADLGWLNPFTPERIAAERSLLGDDYRGDTQVWHVRPGERLQNPNVLEIATRAIPVAQAVRRALAGGERVSADDRALYSDLALYVLYASYEEDFWNFIVSDAPAGAKAGTVEFYRRFANDARDWLATPLGEILEDSDCAHLFAWFFQVRRAFHQIFRHVLGASAAAARHRATIWESIFTHDMRRYRHHLFPRMQRVATLVLGESGTGKELVARAIGLSTYIPFDPVRQCFAVDFRDTYFAVNVTALAPTLVESELFGHRKGAFTGALEDHGGWFEAAGDYGCVFLDEVGDLDPTNQVKLLRVLQNREFCRLGEMTVRPFGGRIIAATNRDLPQRIAAGSFRADFYYRLRGDVIETPPLRTQIAERRDDLEDFVLFIAQQLVGSDEAEIVAEETCRWIARKLPASYPWTGNFRELEQCVRNVLIHGYYVPQTLQTGGADPLRQRFEQGEMTLDEAVDYACTLVYLRSGSFAAAARRLAADRRTVKARVRPEWLEILAPGSSKSSL